MRIDINTHFVELIGTPLVQSFAAHMQNRTYEATGMNLHYLYNDAGTEHLREILDGLRYSPAFIGAAITRPNKVAVMQYLDELDPLCKKVGSCNTVVRTEVHKLKGYNTDAVGFLKALTIEGGFKIAGTRCFCLGAGGVARPIASVLAEQGAEKVYITDLYGESAKQLVADVNRHFPPVTEQVEFGDFSKVAECALVINATGVGMGELIGQTPLPPEHVSADAFYFEACYNPLKTQFLLNAEAAGARCMNGLAMSLYQGAAQYELWTGGQEAPIEIMRSALMEALEEYQEAHPQ